MDAQHVFWHNRFHHILLILVVVEVTAAEAGRDVSRVLVAPIPILPCSYFEQI